MSNKVLTIDAKIMCKHGGQVQLVSSEKLTIGGKAAVIAKGDLLTPPAQINGCGGQTTNGPFDKTVSGISAGLSQKLTVGGQPVVLDSLQAASQVDSAMVCSDAGQKKLTAS